MTKLRFKRVLLFNPLHLNQGGYTPSPFALLYLAGYLRKDKRIIIKIVDGLKNGKKLREIAQIMGFKSKENARRMIAYIDFKIKYNKPKSKELYNLMQKYKTKSHF